jgi:hypothetical protein
VKIFNILSDKSEVDEEYVPILCSLLKLFQYPFMKEKSSDELVYEKVIVECLANLGYLFRTPSEVVRDEICSCIYNLLTFKNVPKPYLNCKRCSREFITRSIQESDLPETIVKVKKKKQNKISFSK